MLALNHINRRREPGHQWHGPEFFLDDAAGLQKIVGVAITEGMSDGCSD